MTTKTKVATKKYSIMACNRNQTTTKNKPKIDIDEKKRRDKKTVEQFKYPIK